MTTTTAAVMKQLHLTESPVARCTTCHEGLNAILTGRKIPFRSPSALRTALQGKASSGHLLFDEIIDRVSKQGEEQMPPHGERLNQDEVTHLRTYLVAVMTGR